MTNLKHTWKDPIILRCLEEEEADFEITRANQFNRYPGELNRLPAQSEGEPPAMPVQHYPVIVYFNIQDRMAGEIKAQAEGK